MTIKGDILISWVYKSHEQLHLGRHSETPQNFSYYHAKLLFVLLSYSFHSMYKQCNIHVSVHVMPLPSAINLSRQGGSKREATTLGATSRSFSRKGLVNHRIGSYTSDSIQDVIHTKPLGYKFTCIQGGASAPVTWTSIRFHSHNDHCMPLSYILHAWDCHGSTCICAPEMYVSNIPCT